MPTLAGLRKSIARFIAAGKRAFAQGAIVDRLSADWRLSSASGNQETRADIRELRRRARALFRDDAYVTMAVREFVQNIVGDQGIRPHPRNVGADGKPAEKANKALVEAFRIWGKKKTASTDRQLSWVALQDRIVESWVIDGEVFIRKHKGFRNAFGFALELIDPDLLDEQLNKEADSRGNAVWMGIEVDKWGAPVFYHFWSHHPSETGRRERIAIPADEIIHLFKQKRTKQLRGVSLLAPIIFRLKMLGAYEDAEVTAARISSSKMGFFQAIPESDAFEQPAPTEKIIMDIAPGSFEQLPPGMEFKPWDPQHPGANVEKFVKAILRSIAAGLGMAYTTLSGDLEGTNYSSIRAGLLSERDFWRRLQGWISEEVHQEVFAEWLDMAILTPLLSLPSKIAERWLDIEWKGRGWKWVDPYNEARANEMMLSLGLTSRTILAAEMGRDFEDMVADLKRENELADAAGVYIGGIAAKKDTPQPDGGTGPSGADATDSAAQKALDDADTDRRELRMLHAVSSSSRTPVVNVTTPDVKVDVKAPDVNLAVTVPAAEGKTVTRKIMNIEDPETGKHLGYEMTETTAEKEKVA
ncbi:MAG: phage portal protein [Gemmatimonadota bacterium]|nr:phage portal protein [Gemmatimonadota bacterium]